MTQTDLALLLTHLFDLGKKERLLNNLLPLFSIFNYNRRANKHPNDLADPNAAI